MKKNYPVLLKLFLSCVLCVLTSLAFADPPTQVMRLGFIDGTVTYSPAGVDEWVNANINRPIVTGDRLWSDTASRAELQLGSAVIRMNESTSINILNIENKSPQIELDQGTVNLHVWKMSYYKGFEIDTPNLAFSVNQEGDYRLDVDPSTNTTTVTVHEGGAIVYGENNTSYQINAGESFRFSGTELAYEALALNEPDQFDQWASTRNTLYDNSISKKYVSSEIIGHTDLDNHGDWKVDNHYGNVWYPRNQRSDWAPYRDGEWVWVEPWGWTWVDSQPWGFAPFHYGRWVYISNNWGWIPGPIAAEPVYAPALVTFYQGQDFNVSVSQGGGDIGWLPLGPGDVYVPPYGYSNNYFSIININNTAINLTIINNVYRNPNRFFAYHNWNAPNAVTAMSKKAFIESHSVNKTGSMVPKSAWAKLRPTHVAALVPTNASVMGNTKIVTVKPSKKVLLKPVIAKTKPPTAPLPFNATKSLLLKTPGKPLSTTTLSTIKVKPSDKNRGQVKVVTSNHPPIPISQNKGTGKKPIQTNPALVPQPVAIPHVVHKPTNTGSSTKPVILNPNPVVVKPINTNPVAVKPINPNPVVVKPINPKPVVVKPINPKPVMVKPINPKPVMVKPINPKPVMVKPINPKPVMVKPINPKPVMVKPINPKPNQGH